MNEVTKDKILEHGEELAEQVYRNAVDHKTLRQNERSRGFKAAVELLWPLVEALKKSKSIHYETGDLEEFLICSKALSILEDKLKYK